MGAEYVKPSHFEDAAAAAHRAGRPQEGRSVELSCARRAYWARTGTIVVSVPAWPTQRKPMLASP